MNRTWEMEPTPCSLSERIRQEASRQMGTGRKLNVASINEHLICALCSGYIIEATSIVECWHTFCRSCITKYLKANKNKDFCPICDVKIQTLRPDKILQDLIYKLVPGLYQNEMKRRREFYSKTSPDEIDVEGEGRGILPQGARFFSQDDSISLSLEYYNGDDCNGEEMNGGEKIITNGKPKRYLQCPGAVTVRHLKKFLRMKYGIGTDYRVDIIYSDECLPEEYSLIDVAYTFAWRRKSPMRFSYRIFTRNAVKTVAPQKSFKTASTVQNNRRNNPKNQSSLEQQRQSEYLGNFNLNPTNTGFFKNQNRSSQSLSESKTKKKNEDPYFDDFQDDSQEKMFPSSEDSISSVLRIISEKENSEESQEFVEEKIKKPPAFDEEAEDGFKKIFKTKHKSEGKKEKKKHDDVYPEKRRKSAGDENKKKSLKRRKSMIENFSEDFESDDKSKTNEEDESENKNEALRKVFVCKDKPERKDEEVRRKKRKKSKHHEGDTKKRKLESEPVSPTILFAKDPLKLKVKLTPIKQVESVEKAPEGTKETEKESETKAISDDGSKKPSTDKERLLHLRAVRHKNKNSPKDYINAPPSLTISKVDSSEQQPVKSSLVESRPSLEIMLVNAREKSKKPEKDVESPKTEKSEKSEPMDTFGVLDLSEKSTRTKEHSSPPPKETSADIAERNKKSTQQSILQIAQTLVSRKLSPENHLRAGLESVSDHSAAAVNAAMRNLMTLSDTAVKILMDAQNKNFSPERFPSPSNKSLTSTISTKSLKDCENGSSLKIPFYPLIGRERPSPIPPIPNLHEIPRGRGRPSTSLNRPVVPTIKPGQNQTVRQIPNPSVVCNRQFNMLRPALPPLKPPQKSPENGDVPKSVNNKINSIPPLQSIKTKLPVPKLEGETKEKGTNDNNPTVPKTINNNNNNTNNNNNIGKTVQNGSDKAPSNPLKNGDENNKKINNIKINHNNSIRRIEMTSRIESVAAGLTARAVSNAMIDAK